MDQKSPIFLGYFVSTFVVKNLQKSPNMISLMEIVALVQLKNLIFI